MVKHEAVHTEKQIELEEVISPVKAHTRSGVGVAAHSRRKRSHAWRLWRGERLRRLCSMYEAEVPLSAMATHFDTTEKAIRAAVGRYVTKTQKVHRTLTSSEPRFQITFNLSQAEYDRIAREASAESRPKTAIARRYFLKGLYADRMKFQWNNGPPADLKSMAAEYANKMLGEMNIQADTAIAKLATPPRRSFLSRLFGAS